MQQSGQREYFSEHLREQSLIDPSMFRPTMLQSWLRHYLRVNWHGNLVKHTAFVAAFPLGLLLLIGNWIERSAIWHVGTMLLAGSATALIVTESEAIFEDYVARLHRFSGEMVGLVRSASNIGYIVGPLCAGFAADWLGSSRTIAVIGLLPAIAAAIALLKFPGKTKLQKALWGNGRLKSLFFSSLLLILGQYVGLCCMNSLLVLDVCC